MSTQFLKPTDILNRTHAVGSFYGFLPFAELAAKGTTQKAGYPEALALDTLDQRGKDVASFLKQVRDAGLAPNSSSPLFVWHTNIAHGRPLPKEITIQFHAISSDRPIADAVLIRAARALMHDLTKQEPVVRINSMGDKETRNRYARELGHFFRKHDAALPPECIACAKKDVLQAAHMLLKSERTETLPSPIDSLSESSRVHFENLLEYLEETDTAYELSPTLLTNGAVWTDTCFELLHEGAHAWGARYHDLARLFFKGSASSIGAIIRLSSPNRDVVPPAKKRPATRFFFIHIGNEAKRVSIRLAEEMRKAHLPLAQAIGVESLTEQMRRAEEANPRYLLIMGRKEALENAVTIRERETYTERTIPLTTLVQELKQIA